MEHYTKANPLRCFFAFAGYDSQAMAMERIKQMHPDFDYRITGWCEIDPHAIRLHNACFPEASRNYGDISKIDWSQVPDFDLFTMSSPCQDFSTAGLQRGGEEGSGTRSSLLWECRKTVIAKRPKYILLENVKGLTNHKNIHGLHRWMRELEGYGYENHAKILNAADYGIPQNRERIFMLSILRESGRHVHLSQQAAAHPPHPRPPRKRTGRRAVLLQPSAGATLQGADRASARWRCSAK